jgi:phosphoglycerate kinase
MHGTAKDILAEATKAGCAVMLPTDAVVATELKANVSTRTVAIGDVPADAMILDVGPATVDALVARLATLRTLVWNGPLGAFETPPFDADTVSALRHAGVLERMSYVSTAGGAFLEWLEGKTLPGVAALQD